MRSRATGGRRLRSPLKKGIRRPCPKRQTKWRSLQGGAAPEENEHLRKRTGLSKKEPNKEENANERLVHPLKILGGGNILER
jgi:hypothetical protein